MYTEPKKTTREQGDSEMSYGSGYYKPFKDFYIAVGEPGPYKNDMLYGEKPLALFADYDIRIKHAPFAMMPKIKNVVVQSWKDEEGDDVFLPYVLGPDGEKLPAITHEAVEYTPTFVMFCPNFGEPVATQNVRRLINDIQGRWLKIWDEYSQLGYDGCVLQNPDDDPRFKRRNYDFIEFTLTFLVNGTALDAPFEGIVTN